MKLPISVIRMRPFRYVVKRNFFSLRSKPAQLPRAGAPLPQDKLIDEEVCPAYNSKHFYPAKPGEILGNRYQILVKIGWGSRSTVWLARDVRRYSHSHTVLSVCLVLVSSHPDTKEDRMI